MQRREFIRKSVTYSLAGTVPVNAIGGVPGNSLTNLSAVNNWSLLRENHLAASAIETVIFKCHGKDVKVHAVQTGACAVKVSHHSKPVPHFLTPLKITMDRHFTKFFPIWVWVIEHPDGVVVIDTGENSGVMEPDYFKPAGKFVAAYNRKNIRFRVNESDEIGNQLKHLGIKEDQIMNVVLTHLHLDHTDGLKHFPATEIIINDKEYNKPSGNIPQLYPSWFKPKLVSYKNNIVDVFDQAYPITASGDLLLVPTPGHTPNHASVLFKTDEVDILFAGDVCYSQHQLLKKELPGIHVNYSQSNLTYNKIMEYASKHRLVFLPSHDAEAASRLKGKTCIMRSAYPLSEALAR